jgi:hypothetical protein
MKVSGGAFPNHAQHPDHRPECGIAVAAEAGRLGDQKAAGFQQARASASVAGRSGTRCSRLKASTASNGPSGSDPSPGARGLELRPLHRGLGQFLPRDLHHAGGIVGPGIPGHMGREPERGGPVPQPSSSTSASGVSRRAASAPASFPSSPGCAWGSWHSAEPCRSRRRLGGRAMGHPGPLSGQSETDSLCPRPSRAPVCVRMTNPRTGNFRSGGRFHGRKIGPASSRAD